MPKVLFIYPFPDCFLELLSPAGVSPSLDVVKLNTVICFTDRNVAVSQAQSPLSPVYSFVEL